MKLNRKEGKLSKQKERIIVESRCCAPKSVKTRSISFTRQGRYKYFSPLNPQWWCWVDCFFFVISYFWFLFHCLSFLRSFFLFTNIFCDFFNHFSLLDFDFVSSKAKISSFYWWNMVETLKVGWKDGPKEISTPVCISFNFTIENSFERWDFRQKNHEPEEEERKS